MTPAERVHLDRRIAEEGMYELRPHGEQPTFASQWSAAAQPRVWTMTAAGDVSRSWTWLDCMVWQDVAAVRVEHDHGQPIDLEQLDDEDHYLEFGW